MLYIQDGVAIGEKFNFSQPVGENRCAWRKNDFPQSMYYFTRKKPHKLHVHELLTDCVRNSCSKLCKLTIETCNKLDQTIRLIKSLDSPEFSTANQQSSTAK